MKRKGGELASIWAIGAILLLWVAFRIVLLIGVFSPNYNIVEIRTTEQGQTELYSLLEQDACPQDYGSSPKISFRQLLAEKIAQTDDLTADTTLSTGITPRACVTTYMDFAKNANANQISPSICANLKNVLPESCHSDINYQFLVYHGRCKNARNQCFNITKGTIDQNLAFIDQIDYIAVPDRTIAIAQLRLQRVS